MMHGRNNNARIDAEILYWLYWGMGYMYTHNDSVQRVENSEQTNVMYIQNVSYRIGFFIDNDYHPAAKLHNPNEIFLRRWKIFHKNTLPLMS